MRLEGSCHCGAVRFSANSRTPYPYMLCYCTICRKTAGGGGYAINIMAEAASLKVEGAENLSVYRVREAGKLSPLRRHFCKHCASALYVADPHWPDWIWPFASAIDTPLPTPPERVHIMLEFKAPWAEVPEGETETCFQGYPGLSIEAWHQAHNLKDPKT